MSQAHYRSWPFKEAFKLQQRYAEPPAAPVKFETGFGPSGLPHIGTFAEVARTTWVRQAFEFQPCWPTELIAFSDDMDGLRKVPLNMPQQQMLKENIGKPLAIVLDDRVESAPVIRSKLRDKSQITLGGGATFIEAKDLATVLRAGLRTAAPA